MILITFAQAPPRPAAAGPPRPRDPRRDPRDPRRDPRGPRGPRPGRRRSNRPRPGVATGGHGGDQQKGEVSPAQNGDFRWIDRGKWRFENSKIGISDFDHRKIGISPAKRRISQSLAKWI